jgi:hypothetical protein
MLVIFPFEEPFYRDAGVRVTFVGHPLVELARPAPDPRAFLALQGLDPGRPVLAVLPGSRRQEIAHNLPPIAGALDYSGAAARHSRLAIAPGRAGRLNAALGGVRAMVARPTPWAPPAASSPPAKHRQAASRSLGGGLSPVAMSMRWRT